MRPDVLRACACWLALTVPMLVASAQSVPTPEAAQGVFVVQGPGVMLAFRVDPWSADMHQIQGIGRCVFQPDSAQATAPTREVVFQIVGSYRPAREQAVEGIFVYSQPELGRTQAVPWSGSFNPLDGRFDWSATVADNDHSLGAAIPWTPPAESSTPVGSSTASASAPPVTAPPQPPTPPDTGSPMPDPPADPPGDQAHYFRAGDVTDDQGDLDFGKLITAVVTEVPDAPAGASGAKQPSAVPVSGATGPSPGDNDLAILILLTDMGKGIRSYGKNELGPEQILERVLKRSAGPKPPRDAPIRNRGELPAETDPPRTRRALVKPGTPPPDDPPPDSDTPLINEFHNRVPDVTGLSFENAVTALWKAGLQPTPVECLGHATDPAKADRIVAQTPAGGEPCPANGQIKLQWYTSQARPADPAGTADATGALYRIDGSYRLNDATHTFATLADNIADYDFSLRVQFETNQGPYDRTTTMQGVLLERSKDHIKIDIKSISPPGQWGVGAVLFRRNGEGMTMEVGGRTIGYSR